VRFASQHSEPYRCCRRDQCRGRPMRDGAEDRHFVNARFTRCIWPSGIARQDLRNWYFIFVRNSGGCAPLDRGRIWLIAAGRCSLGHEQFHLSISEAQFKMIDKGAALGSSTLVLIRNFWPSPLTS
jgi:hypothetical protein